MTESHLIAAVSRTCWRAAFFLAAASLQPAKCESRAFKLVSVSKAPRKTINQEIGWCVCLTGCPPLLPLSQQRLSAPRV